LDPIIPMEPVSSETIPVGEEWVAQIKWDGVRVLTYYDGQVARLFNRKRRDRTIHYPELTDISKYCGARSVILDGEVIALGPDGKPSFHEIMRRDGIRRMERLALAQRTIPITYMIFDVIFYNGEWVYALPFRERNQILREIVTPKDGSIQLVDSFGDGQSLFEVVKAHGLEGIVMKRLDSPYRIGEKRDLWIKIKNYRDLIAVIGGYTLNGGIVNSLLLGLYDEQDRFLYIGHAGSGKLSSEEWRALTELLKPLTVKERPFANQPERNTDAFWVSPVLTVKIRYIEWTPGHTLRQPSIQALVDVSPKECTYLLPETQKIGKNSNEGWGSKGENRHTERNQGL
jgi:bifunctional non-homologous end joining protein LigD